MGRGKNAPKNLYIHKALSLIDAELELLNLKIIHPEQFNSPVSTEFKSDLYVIPKSKDLGIIGIAEIVLGLFLQGEITGTEHIQPEVTISVFLYCINSNQRNGGLLWEKLNVELIFMET